MEKTIDRILNLLIKASQLILGVVIFVMAMANVIQVVTRYMVSVQVLWVEDVSMMGLYWIFALGTPMCWILKQHLNMNAFEQKMSAKVRQILWAVQNVIGLAGGLGLIYLGRRCMRVNKGFVMSAIGFDEGLRYLPLVVGGAFLAAVCVLLLVQIFVTAGKKEDSNS